MDVPTGYRLMKNGEIINDSCYYLSNNTHAWEPFMALIRKGGTTTSLGDAWGKPLVPFCIRIEDIITTVGNRLKLDEFNV